MFAFYLLCPYSILACVGQSTGVFSNLLIAFSLLFATLNSRLLASLFITLLAFNSFHLLVLILPIALIIELKRNFSCTNCIKFDRIDFEFKLKRDDDDELVNNEKINGEDKLVKNIVFSVYSILATSLICLAYFSCFLIASFFLMDKNFDFINCTFLFA